MPAMELTGKKERSPRSPGEVAESAFEVYKAAQTKGLSDGECEGSLPPEKQTGTPRHPSHVREAGLQGLAWSLKRCGFPNPAKETKALHCRDPQRLLQETFQVAQKTR